MPELQVHQLRREDVYRDIIRINEKHRINKFGQAIKEGRVCLVRANAHRCLAILRGHQDSDAPEIRMDDYTRTKLKLAERESYEFEFKEVGLIGEWRWAWSSTEMGYRVASRIALIGLVMGLVGLLLGIVSIVK